MIGPTREPINCLKAFVKVNKQNKNCFSTLRSRYLDSNHWNHQHFRRRNFDSKMAEQNDNVTMQFYVKIGTEQFL